METFLVSDLFISVAALITSLLLLKKVSSMARFFKVGKDEHGSYFILGDSNKSDKSGYIEGGENREIIITPGGSL